MPNHASCHLAGHIGKDPELKSLANGTPVLKFSLCVNTGFGEKKTASWYECAYFGKPAESVHRFLSKGKAVMVVGEPSIRKWQSENGKSGTSVDVRVSNIVLLGDGHEKSGGQAQEPAQEPAPNQDEIPF